jgi:hypothetical protein
MYDKHPLFRTNWCGRNGVTVRYYTVLHHEVQDKMSNIVLGVVCEGCFDHEIWKLASLSLLHLAAGNTYR